MKKGISVNSRQHQILMLLLRSSLPITIREISLELKISISTVQRELDGLDRLLLPFGLTFVKKTGVGLHLEGEDDAKKELFDQINIRDGNRIFTPEERQYLLTQMLLTLQEPAKLFFFSSKLGVAMATVSNDLDKLEPWFERHKIRLIRKPGVGIHLEVQELSIRAAIIDLLYQHFSQEQLMDILSSYSSYTFEKDKLELSVRNHLLHFIAPDTISQIEGIVRQTEKVRGFEMTDSAYVGFVIHIALVIQRLQHGESITIDTDSLRHLRETEEFRWARVMARKLNEQLEVDIPESEVGYITMHLLGAKGKRIFALANRPGDVKVEHYVEQMIRIVGQDLKLELEYDNYLIDSLTAHLESAIHRLLLNMDIRNPILGHIRDQYPEVYAATARAVCVLEENLCCNVPEEEIGYLALHFGAAILRQKGSSSHGYRVLLTCPSGMGTSKLLATQLEKQFPNIRIVEIVSLLHIENAIEKHAPIDLIISTVSFSHEKHQVIAVNSFLGESDISLIEQYLNRPPLSRDVSERETTEIEGTVTAISLYGEAVMLLTNHLFLESDLTVVSKEDLIHQAIAYVGERIQQVEQTRLKEDLLEREQRGAFVLEDEGLAILHCRSDAISTLCVCLFQLKRAVDWGDSQNAEPVSTVLILLAPHTAPKEYIEMISSVSAELAEEQFVQSLTGDEIEGVRNKFKAVLGRVYMDKTRAVFRGQL
ncbi:BglG family transcription antiterminator [Paenibacillus chitinolyticus]